MVKNDNTAKKLSFLEKDGYEVKIKKFKKELIGKSTLFVNAIDTFSKLIKFSPLDVPILVCGETGTGKTHIVKKYSIAKRCDQDFTLIPIQTLSEGIFESELFGNTKGAFTGADRTKDGLIKNTNDNSIIAFDEIGDASSNVQKKILDLLQERRKRRVGSNNFLDVNAEFVFLTNADLKEDMSEGKFRQDLYHRLSTIIIKIPPLRERTEDIPSLAKFFLKKCEKKWGIKKIINKTVIPILLDYNWPGNVRELKNVIENLYLLSEKIIITEKEVEKAICDISPEKNIKKHVTELDLIPGHNFFETMRCHEIKLMKQALILSGGVGYKAAKLLGMHRPTFIVKAQKFGLKI